MCMYAFNLTYTKTLYEYTKKCQYWYQLKKNSMIPIKTTIRSSVYLIFLYCQAQILFMLKLEFQLCFNWFSFQLVSQYKLLHSFIWYFIKGEKIRILSFNWYFVYLCFPLPYFMMKNVIEKWILFFKFDIICLKGKILSIGKIGIKILLTFN